MASAQVPETIFGPRCEARSAASAEANPDTPAEAV